jgi:hypothetical protein
VVQVHAKVLPDTFFLRKRKTAEAVFLIVPRRGLEPPQIALLDPKSSASTNFATWAYEIVPESITEILG